MRLKHFLRYIFGLTVKEMKISNQVQRSPSIGKNHRYRGKKIADWAGFSLSDCICARSKQTSQSVCLCVQATLGQNTEPTCYIELKWPIALKGGGTQQKYFSKSFLELNSKLSFNSVAFQIIHTVKSLFSRQSVSHPVSTGHTNRPTNWLAWIYSWSKSPMKTQNSLALC